MASDWEYRCTANAHDPETLTRHLNHMAHDGWELFTVTFAIKGESGVHTFFWRRPAANAPLVATPSPARAASEG